MADPGAEAKFVWFQSSGFLTTSFASLKTPQSPSSSSGRFLSSLTHLPGLFIPVFLDLSGSGLGRGRPEPQQQEPRWWVYLPPAAEDRGTEPGTSARGTGYEYSPWIHCPCPCSWEPFWHFQGDLPSSLGVSILVPLGICWFEISFWMDVLCCYFSFKSLRLTKDTEGVMNFKKKKPVLPFWIMVLWFWHSHSSFSKLFKQYLLSVCLWLK